MSGRARSLLIAVIAATTLAAVAADKPPRPLDPRGRPDESLIKQPRRYYVWHDADGWHLRSAARALNKFEGVIRTVGGSIRKCRPAGLEAKGGGADQWALDSKREELRFLINTSTSFDGFDFDVDGAATEIEFELRIGGNDEPKRIYVGKSAKNPPAVKFRLPANPDRAFAASAAP